MRGERLGVQVGFTGDVGPSGILQVCLETPTSQWTLISD